MGSKHQEGALDTRHPADPGPGGCPPPAPATGRRATEPSPRSPGCRRGCSQPPRSEQTQGREQAARRDASQAGHVGAAALSGSARSRKKQTCILTKDTSSSKQFGGELLSSY